MAKDTRLLQALAALRDAFDTACLSASATGPLLVVCGYGEPADAAIARRKLATGWRPGPAGNPPPIIVVIPRKVGDIARSRPADDWR